MFCLSSLNIPLLAQFKRLGSGEAEMWVTWWRKGKKLTNCAQEQSGKQGEGANRQVGRRELEVNITHNTHTHRDNNWAHSAVIYAACFRQVLSAHHDLQEDASQNGDDVATVITLISAAVITQLTSILFAFRRHISNPFSAGVPKIRQSFWQEKGENGPF